MHCCWEGVVAQLISLWIDSKNHNNPWYIGTPSNIAQINKKIEAIQVPHNFRQPLPIDCKISWKGIYIS
jgi:hypothetical protein